MLAVPLRIARAPCTSGDKKTLERAAVAGLVDRSAGRSYSPSPWRVRPAEAWSKAIAVTEDGLELARRDQLRLVIVDVCLPDLSGYEVCRQLKERFGEGLPVLMVSGHRTESFDRVAGLLIGADDYLAKPFAADELLARVRGLVRRAPSLAPSLASRLTAREMEVLQLLARGHDQDDIAGRLFISRKTVATHIDHILQKLGVRTRAQAVAFAYREDLLVGLGAASTGGA
jgi:DNA-binding NarL/FixJ family response regulator